MSQLSIHSVKCPIDAPRLAEVRMGFQIFTKLQPTDLEDGNLSGQHEAEGTDYVPFSVEQESEL